MSLPRVTVVLVYSRDDVEAGRFQTATYGIEQQDYPAELRDLILIERQGDNTVADLQTYGVKHSDTDLVVMACVHDEWTSDALQILVLARDLLAEHPYMLDCALCEINTLTIGTRDEYLARVTP